MKVVFDQNISLKFLQQENRRVENTMQKISSGLQINKAADDPSYLAIVKNMRARIGGVETAIQNVQDAISLYQTQDTGLGNCELKLIQMKVLAIRASNEAVLRNDCLDRTRLNQEVQNLKNAIQDIAVNTTFNTKQILIGDPIIDITAKNPSAIHNGETGSNPTWDSTGKTVYYDSDRKNPKRNIDDDSGISRIWSNNTSATARTMETSDPYTYPNSDGDDYVKHPLSDSNDNNPFSPDTGGTLIADTDVDGIVDFFDNYPGVDQKNPANIDMDGDGETDAYDPWPNDGAQWSTSYADADLDGWPDDKDAAPGDPLNPGAPPADSDGDGVIDILDPWPGQTANNPASPRDTDGDGIVDAYDTYGTIDVFNPPDIDGDGIPGVPGYDPDDNDPALPFKDVDADDDGIPAYLDGGPGDTTGTGDDSNKYLPLTVFSYEDRSPDSGSRGVAFASNRNTPYTSAADPWVSDIFILNNGTMTPLTNDPEIDENPVWSDDGNYLAWLRDGALVYVPMEACQQDNSISTIATDPAGIENPVWQPNTNNVFFNKGQDIFYADLGGAEYQLEGTLSDGTIGPVQGEDMAFSPEGEFLWYHRGGQNYFFDMVRMEEHIFNGIGANALDGDWAPTGDRITYEQGGKIFKASLEFDYETVHIQAGPTGDPAISGLNVHFADARVGSLGIGNISVGSQDSAMKAIDIADTGLSRLNAMRAQIGIEVLRLQHIADDLNTEKINLMAAASTIEDADMAKEITSMAKSNIILDSANSISAISDNVNMENTKELINDRLYTQLNAGYTKYRAGMY